MKILIIGKRGMLGQDLAVKYSRIHDVSIVGRPQLDLIKPETIQQVFNEQAPAVVINCAAMTNVDQCERDPETAMKVNGEGPGHLAKASADIGAKLVHVSTDYVFAGRPDVPYSEQEPTSPISAYARSKDHGEKRVRQNLDNHLIVRVAWVFGYNDKSFVRYVLRMAKTQKQVPVINDQIGSVTYTMDIGDGIEALLENDCRGTYHLTNEGYCTRYRFAEEIFRLKGLAVSKLKPITSQALGWIAPRPKTLLLSKDKLKRDTGYIPRHWKEALREYLQEKNHGQERTA